MQTTSRLFSPQWICLGWYFHAKNPGVIGLHIALNYLPWILLWVTEMLYRLGYFAHSYSYFLLPINFFFVNDKNLMSFVFKGCSMPPQEKITYKHIYTLTTHSLKHPSPTDSLHKLRTAMGISHCTWRVVLIGLGRSPCWLTECVDMQGMFTFNIWTTRYAPITKVFSLCPVLFTRSLKLFIIEGNMVVVCSSE